MGHSVARVVVDELVVALRLDDSQFDRAVAEAIAARQKLSDESEKSAKKESSSIGALAARWLTLAAALKLVTKAFDKFQNIADNLRDLSNESRRLGMSSSGLRTWQNAIELLGGKAGDATSEVEKFTESLNNLIFKGEVGDNLQWLNRLGITPQRGMTYDNTARQVFTGIQQGLASGTIKDRQEAGFIARQAGFGGVGDFITQRKGDTIAEFDAFLKGAGSRVASEGDIDKGRDYSEGRITRRQERYGPLADTFMSAEEALDATMEKINDGFIKMLDWLNSPDAPWNDGGSAMRWMGFGGKMSSIGGGTDSRGNALPVNSETGRTAGSVADRIAMWGRSFSVPTPNVMNGASSSKSVTINQTNNIRSTDPVAAGNAVADKTRKAVSAQADGAAR